MPGRGWWRDDTGAWREPDDIDSTPEDINFHACFYLKTAGSDPLLAEELARRHVEISEARRQIIAAIWDISTCDT